MKIHVSESTYSSLQHFKLYTMTPRGSIEVKGKGSMKTYWLTGKDGYDKPLPSEMLSDINPSPSAIPMLKLLPSEMQSDKAKSHIKSNGIPTTWLE